MISMRHHGMNTATRRRGLRIGTSVLVAAALAGLSSPASADVFNGRIAFTSLRDGDREIYTVTARGGDPRQLTVNAANDAQPDWAPDGRALAYRVQVTRPRTLFQVARMQADGEQPTQLSFPVPTGREQGSQPSWFPDGSGILFRRSGTSVQPAVWRIGPWGEDPMQVLTAAGRQWDPRWTADMTRILFAWTRSEPADTDRAIAISAPSDPTPTVLFDDPGVFDSAPARSPDGSRIAFESDSNRLGTNPEGDREIFVMNADGSDVRQLTRNAIHDEGPAWSPDQTMLAYTSGPDNEHGDIQIMTADGVHLRTLASYDGLDESPDWQAIPAPATDRHCGDLTTYTADLVDVRAAGDGLSCAKARRLAAAWATHDHPNPLRAYAVETEGFGGTLRVHLTPRGNQDGTGNDKLVAFLLEPR